MFFQIELDLLLFNLLSNVYLKEPNTGIHLSHFNFKRIYQSGNYI